MVAVEASYENAFEKRSPTLFLIGGILAVGHAMIMGIKAFTEIATPPEVFAPVGQLFVFGGLLGLYLTLADQTPRLARAGGSFVALGIVGFAAITAGKFAELAGIDPPSWFAVFTLFGIIGMVPGFLTFGVASLRADVHSQTVGFLLMTPAVLFLVLIAEVLVFEASSLAGLIVGSGLALTHLAIGYTLRSETRPADSPTPTGNTTVS